MGLHNRTTTQVIGKIVEKFEETRVVINIERPVHGLHNRPTRHAIGKIVKKFVETRVVINIERPVYQALFH